MTDDPDETDIDTGDITEHPPDVDIDLYVENCNMRVERMWERGLWVCAYTHDDEESDHHYDIKVTKEGGLHITHREEFPE